VLTPRPTFADRMRALDEQLTMAIAAAQAAHSEARRLHTESCVEDGDLTMPTSRTIQAYQSMRFVGDLLIDLQAAKGRL
jgi:hypothetical protein